MNGLRNLRKRFIPSAISQERWIIGLLVLFFCTCTWSATNGVAIRFQKDVESVLRKNCYECHADGAKKGGVAFDELDPHRAPAEREVWLKVFREVRSGLMPPEKKSRLLPGERKRLEEWIKHDAFGIDSTNLDPGPGMVRRLNRVEYRNTIRDLMGIDFNTDT
jgi:hypothetical protein